MKRKLQVLFMAMLVILTMVSIAWATPSVLLDNQQLTFDVPPAIEDGRTLVPLRAIFEKLGATVAWDQQSQTVTATKGNLSIYLKVGAKNATVNNKTVAMDVPAKVINGRTLVPLRFVSEAMGAYVGWDATTQTIRILKSQPQYLTVTRVVDGDTVELADGTKIRLIGVDTPESTTEIEYYGKEASAYTKGLLEGKKIWLEYDQEQKDRYDRTLAYIYTENGAFVNALLIANGYAEVMTIAPNNKYANTFEQLEQKAKATKKGMWETQPTSQPEQPVKTGTYVGSAESDKYHFPSCRWAEKITPENEVWFADVADAKAHGYKPCGVCKPTEN